MVMELESQSPQIFQANPRSMACWSCKAEARARRTLGETGAVDCTHDVNQVVESPVTALEIVPHQSQAESPVLEQVSLSEERKAMIIGPPKKHVPTNRQLKSLPCLNCGKLTGKSFKASYCNIKCRKESNRKGIRIFKSR